MKKKIFLIMMLLTLFSGSLVSCGPVLPPEPPVNGDDIQDDDLNNDTNDNNKEDEDDNAYVYTKTLSSGDIYSSNLTYATNFDNVTINSTNYVYYRAGKYNSSYLVNLIPYSGYDYGTTLPASFSNATAIRGIREISIKYRTTGSNPILPSVSYGKTLDLTSSQSLELTASGVFETVSIKTKNANFFKIETETNNLYIYELSIKYTDINDNSETEFLSSGKSKYRINPVRYSGNLVSGSSKVRVPIDVTSSLMGCVVNKYKEYTYYTYEAVQSNTSLASVAACVEPIDVINYYIAFGQIPANYVSKKSTKFNNAKNIFGSNTRVYQIFDRTDGYAQFVPYETVNGKPSYYEFDIAIDSTYGYNSRGVGRVVMWDYGFSTSKGASGYDSAPVAVYTDDHYQSFMEYYNNGTFSYRFNAESTFLQYTWGAPRTISII